MGILPSRSGHARRRHDADRNHDRRKPQARLRGGAGLAAGLILAAASLAADPIRIATFNTELSQAGPGLLLRDILRETDQVANVVETIVRHAPDILVLQSIDFDTQGAAARALSDLIHDKGLDLPHVYAPVSNTGIPTGFDIDGDGRRNAPRDAQGFGRYPGEASIALFSRYPILSHEALLFNELLWKDAAPNTHLQDLLPAEAIQTQRLASVAMAAIPVAVKERRVWILTHHATPPVFDGPEDRNGHRNADENRFWLQRLEDGFLDDPFVLAAQLNIDPHRGEGHHAVVADLIASPYVVDPLQGWLEEDRHSVTYAAPGPGKLRVSYVLPAPAWQLVDAGMSQDRLGSQLHSRHRLVWVDVEFAP